MAGLPVMRVRRWFSFVPRATLMSARDTRHNTIYIVFPIQLKIKIKNTNYANASHKYCTCAERNIVSQTAGWGTVQGDLW